MNAQESGSTRPYLIRALYEWCSDQGLTPYIAVLVDDSVQVPREYVKDGEIVLNISADATSSLQLGNDFIEFKARFAGVPREIMVPVARVIAIYARENGQGMAFAAPAPTVLQSPPFESASDLTSPPPVPADAREAAHEPHSIHLVPAAETGDDLPDPPRPSSGGARPALKRVK